MQKKEVHLWKFLASGSGSELEKYYEFLSEDEKNKAKSYFFENHRNQYIKRRGFLRALLSAYTEIPAGQIIFNYNKYGKPYIGNSLSSFLYFNLSTSNGLAVYAVSFCENIGIDIEFIRSLEQMENIVNDYFSELEKNFFFECKENKRKELFFKYWTKKEAYLKAIGEGLSYPLNMFTVCRKNMAEKELFFVDDPSRNKKFSIKEINVLHNYEAAIAVEGDDWVIRDCQ